MTKKIKNLNSFDSSNSFPTTASTQLFSSIPIQKNISSEIKPISKVPIKKNKKEKKPTKIPIRKGPWSPEEDKLLRKWVKQNGPKDWEACGRFIKGRKGKQCREHWNNCLNPKLIKGHWTTEEDFLIMFFYEKCKGSWKKIIPLFNGRIENSIKNRFYSQLRKYATRNTKERKIISSRIKLHELKKYLNEAITKAKYDLLKKTKMTQKQFDLFLLKNEQKLKDSEYKDDLVVLLSTNSNSGHSSLDDDFSEINSINIKKTFENDLSEKKDNYSLNNYLVHENTEFSSNKEDSDDIFKPKEPYREKKDLISQSNCLFYDGGNFMRENYFINKECDIDYIILNTIQDINFNLIDKLGNENEEIYKYNISDNKMANYGSNPKNFEDNNYFEFAFKNIFAKEE